MYNERLKNEMIVRHFKKETNDFSPTSHLYEIIDTNVKILDDLKKNGMVISGTSPDGRIVEMIEIQDHPWFVATQAHPEFKSRPNRAHPLFKGFVKASKEYAHEHETN